MNRILLFAILSLSLAAELRAQQIEAEAWSAVSGTAQAPGLQTEAAVDEGGTLNVGWIDPGDWAEYQAIPLAAGNWRVDARMATTLVNRQIVIKVDGVAKTTLTYAGNTNGWQTWATVSSATFNVAAGGNHVIRLEFPGNSMNLNWVRFVAINGDVTAPAAVTGLGATAPTGTTANLTWTASADAGLSGYQVYRGATLIAYLGKVTTYQATGLSPNTAYGFTVRARDLANNLSAAGATANVTTPTVANLLTNGDFSAGNASWTAYQGTALNFPGEYAVNTPVTPNVYDVNVWQKVPMTIGTTYKLTFRARSSLARNLTAGIGLAQDPWSNLSKPFPLTAAWVTHSETWTSNFPSNISSRVFFDLGGPSGGEIHIDDVVLAIVTAQPLTPPTSFTSSAQGNNAITLNWSGAGPVAAVTGYQLTYTPGNVTVQLGNVATTQVVGLAQNTQYTFQIKSKDAVGTLSATAAQVIASTTNLDQTAPSIPGVPTSSAQNGNSITLAWAGSTDPVGGSGLAGYNLRQIGGSAQTYALGNVTTFVVQPLAEATSYTFDVQARDVAGNLSTFGPALTVSTKDVSAPNLPSPFASTGRTTTTITLGWTKPADNVGVTGYDIIIDGQAAVPVAGGLVTTVTYGGYAPNSTHTYRLQARDAAGNVSGFTAAISVTTVAPDTDAPTVPGNLTAPAPEKTAINLAWLASTDGTGSGVAEYQVEQTLPVVVPAPTWSAGLALNFKVTPLAHTTAYAFRVRARDVAGNWSAFTSPVNVSTLDGSLPSIPTGLIASATMQTSITLTWNPSTDVGGTVKDYDIQQTAPVANAFNAIVSAPFQINGLAVGTAYTFRIQARDVAGNVSGFSPTYTVSTPDQTPPTVPGPVSSPIKTNTSINLAWPASTDVGTGVAGYEVQRTLPAPIVTYPQVTVPNYQAIGLTAATAYTFQVRARDQANNWSAFSAPFAVTTNSNTVPNLLANGDFAGGVVLPWKPFPNPPNMTVAGEYAVNPPASANVYDVNLVQELALTQGTTYSLTFRARSSTNRSIVSGWGFAHTPWDNQVKTVDLVPTWRDYVYSAVSGVATDNNSRVFFDVGKFAGEVHIDDVVFTIGAYVDIVAPEAPAAPAASSQTETTIAIGWAVPYDNVEVTGYQIDTNGVLHSVVGAVNAATLGGLKKNTTYAVRMRARDAAGNWSPNSPVSNLTTANDQAPAPLKIEAENWTIVNTVPQMNGLQTENTTDAGLGLNVGWIDANDWAEYHNQPLAAGTYKLEARMATMDVNRQVQLFVDGTLRTTVTQPIATGGWQTWVTAISADFNVATGGNHLVRVVFPGNNMNLNWIRFVPQAPDLTPPTAPTGLATTGQGGTTISVSWNASTDPGGTGVAGYRLYANGILNTTVGPVNAGTLTGLTASTQYQITIKAFDGAGNESAASAALAVSTNDGSNLNGIYALRNRNSAKCVEIQGGSLADGGAGIQNNCDGSRQQKWEFIQVTATNYKLRNVNSAKLLDVKNAGATDDIQQWADGNGTAQIWTVTPVAGVPGTYTLKATSDATECLDVLNGSTVAGTALKTLACNGQTRQQFTLFPTDAGPACLAGPAPASSITTETWWDGVPFFNPMETVQEPAGVPGSGWVVMDQRGMIRRMGNDKNSAGATFLDWQNNVYTIGESGLASLAFDPDYVNNHYVYITYISKTAGNLIADLKLSRFTTFADYKSVNAATEVVIYRFKRSADIHHSGALVFGPGPVNGTSYLYMSVGDNGNNAQDPNLDPTPSLVIPMNRPNGKILRFTLGEARGTTALIYDYNVGTIDPKYVVATGLRNPWRMSFDGTDLWISNVGYDTNEEINKFNVLGDPLPNFGWPWCEGSLCCSGSARCDRPGMTPKPPNSQLVFPIHEYNRADGNGGEGAAIAGHVYRGTAIPSLVGKFIFADYTDKILYALDPATKVRTIVNVNGGVGNIDDFGIDRNGELYLTDYGGPFKIKKLIPAASQPLVWPPQNLADAGCFTALDDTKLLMTGKPGVNPFAVAQTFWSDGAKKQRYVSLPPGATLDVSDQNDWKLPPGGVTIKNFLWPATNKVFETRLFVRHTTGEYAGYTYKWNGPNSATLVGDAAETANLNGHVWEYPTRGQCMTCHNDRITGSIALESHQLNTLGQIANMQSAGILSAPINNPAEAFPKEDWTEGTLSKQAQSYLHVNCANCHRGATQSSAGRATWDARFDTPLPNKNACNAEPFEQMAGGDANQKIIKPGTETGSTVWLRAHVRGVGTGAMPPLGSKLVDEAGVQVLANWIKGLSGTCTEP